MEGLPGLRGPIGPTGIAGIVGTQGERGVLGGNGSIGMTGMQGSQGLQGLPGISVTPMGVQILYSTVRHDLELRIPALEPHATNWSGSPAFGMNPDNPPSAFLFSTTIRGMRVYAHDIAPQNSLILLPRGTYYVEAGVSVPSSSVDSFQGQIIFHNEANSVQILGSTFSTLDIFGCPTSFLSGCFEVLGLSETFQLRYKISAGPQSTVNNVVSISVPFEDIKDGSSVGRPGLFVTLIRT